jgi:uncharacterized protein
MIKFIVDAMLGKLVKELRMLGYDTLYYRGKDLHELIQLASQQERVILTRNTRLNPETTENPIIRVIEDNPVMQLKELLRQGVIAMNEETSFSRCLLCNAFLDNISREEAEGKVPDFVFHQQKAFFRCPRCQKIYWPGTHQQRMKKRVKELLF